MPTELHVAWVYDCEECGKENFLRAVTGDASEIVRLLSEGEPVQMLVAEEEHVEQIGPELHEAPSVIAELAIAPMYVKCQHCGHRAPAEPCKLDEESSEPPIEPPGNNKAVVCQHCGRTFITAEDTEVARCSRCGGESIVHG